MLERFFEQKEKVMSRISKLLMLGIGMVIATGLWSFLYTSVVNGLPRRMQGESLMVSPEVCEAGYWVVPVLVAGIFCRTLRGWVVCGAVVLVMLCFWYFGVGFEELLHKAWRRGL